MLPFTARIKPHVLIVEDEPDNREMLAELLAIYGYTVTTATNGREALALLRTTPPPGVLLLDLIMPVMNGWELVAVLSEDSALNGIPIVITSGSEPAPTKGVIRVLKKPLDMKVLLKLLESIASDKT